MHHVAGHLLSTQGTVVPPALLPLCREEEIADHS
jgi:hypothetical protein